MKKIITLILTLGLVASFLTACGKKENEIIIMDGNFSEMQIVHQMVKILVEENTDVQVTIKDEISGVNGFKEILRGNSDIMNSYDGTLLTTYLKLAIKDIPEQETLYDFANEKAHEEFNVTLLDKIGTNNTYAIAVPPNIADKYNLNTISDLIPVANELVFGAEHEFYSEEGSMKYNPFIDFYGLDFKQSKPIDLGLKYSAVENGQLDVTVVYATDGLNKKAGLKILEDDQNFFPEYNGSLLVSEDLFTKFKDIAPNLKDVLNKLGGQINNEEMTDLTYSVDVDGKTPYDVAVEFLTEKDLLK